MAVQRAVLQTVLRSRGAVSVYIHWPFCSTICSYCDFTKYRSPARVDHLRMSECLAKEISTHLQHYSSVNSVYFGGGTPSLAPASTIAAVLDAVGGKLVEGAEVTLEVNPSVAVLPKLQQFKYAGVDRLSVGVQSFDDRQLSALNRDHTSASARAVLSEALHLFQGRVNIDLIFGLPGQTLQGFESNLSTALQFGCNHLSLYQLTVERGTPLAKGVSEGVVSLPSEDSVVDMYEYAVEKLEQEGLCRYEISNFARPGFESRHNLFYWFGGSYIGVGTGAHSRLRCNDEAGFIRAVNTLTPAAWMRAVEKNGCSLMMSKKMTLQERMEEIVSTSLRTSTGLHSSVCLQHGLKLDELVATIDRVYPEYLTNKLLLFKDNVLRASNRGLLVLDSILPGLMSCISAISFPESYTVSN